MIQIGSQAHKWINIENEIKLELNRKAKREEGNEAENKDDRANKSWQNVEKWKEEAKLQNFNRWTSEKTTDEKMKDGCGRKFLQEKRKYIWLDSYYASDEEKMETDLKTNWTY